MIRESVALSFRLVVKCCCDRQNSAKLKKQGLKPCMGTYKVMKSLRPVGYLIESEVGCTNVPTHANRLRRTAKGVQETGESFDRVFLDFLWTIAKISNVTRKRSPQTEKRKRHFKGQLFERRSSEWTPQSGAPETAV